MSTSNGKSYPKGTASTCHDVSMTQVSETPKGVSPIFTELVALVQLEPNLSVGVSAGTQFELVAENRLSDQSSSSLCTKTAHTREETVATEVRDRNLQPRSEAELTSC